MHRSPKPQPPPPRPRPPAPAPTSTPPPPSSSKFFSESELPSIKSGFLTPAKERSTRQKTCRFLEEAARCLRLPRVTTSTSMVFFHRFYAAHSFEDHDRFEVSVACLLLAAKTEESPKKLVTVLQECFKLKNMSARKSGAGNDDPKVKVDRKGYLDMKCEEFLRLKERVLLLERVILHTIGFELSVAHPYKLLVEQIKKVVPLRQLEYIDPSLNPPRQDKMMKELVQNSMNFANDSMHTSICLQFPPKTIAHACVYMSGQFCKMKPTEGKKWLDILDLTMWDLATIVMQIMELIAGKRGSIDDSVKARVHADLDKMKAALGGGGSSSGGARPPPPSDGGSGNERDPKRQRIQK